MAIVSFDALLYFVSILLLSSLGVNSNMHSKYLFIYYAQVCQMLFLVHSLAEAVVQVGRQRVVHHLLFLVYAARGVGRTASR